MTILLSAFFCARLLSAQGPILQAPLGSNTANVAMRQLEAFACSVKQGKEGQARQAAEARAAELSRVQFQAKANRFVALWTDFVGGLNDRQAFDAKLAKKLSKAFHELETSDGWPIRDRLNGSDQKR